MYSRFPDDPRAVSPSHEVKVQHAENERAGGREGSLVISGGAPRCGMDRSRPKRSAPGL